jgi:hypothetical protein
MYKGDHEHQWRHISFYLKNSFKIATKTGIGPIIHIYFVLYIISTISKLIPSKARSPGTYKETMQILQYRVKLVRTSSTFIYFFIFYYALMMIIAIPRANNGSAAILLVQCIYIMSSIKRDLVASDSWHKYSL